MLSRSIHTWHSLAWLLSCALALHACGTSTPTNPAPQSLSESTPLSGAVTVDGSSTLLPVSQVMANSFEQAHPSVTVAVQASGTGGGFKKFCAGGIDIVGASRPINAAEDEECRANRIAYLELPVAFDSLSVVVNPRNSFVTCLTVPELRLMWEPAAEGRVTRWSQVRTGLPERPIALFGPGTSSGTFDYFTLAVVGTQSSSRSDYTKSEDDEVLAAAVAKDPNAIGYFGYAYYLEHKDKLKLVAIDGGAGCVTPSPETVADDTYRPLSRPVFVYVNNASTSRPEVHAFAQFYVNPDNASRVQGVGYVPLPTATLLAVSRRLERGVTGTVFGARGSILGLTAASFQDEDEIKNALVR